ncbi:MAG: PD-(D/E)XK nuclease family protein, partial [Gammaproteobacteria bacterium]
ARQAMQAWRLMKQWHLPLSELAGIDSLECQSLRDWSKKFETVCHQKKLLSPALLPEFIGQALLKQQLPGEKRVIFAGFEDPNKLHDSLATSLQHIGIETNRLKQESLNQNITVEKYADMKAELSAAALWAKAKLLENPTQKLAIVIPELNEHRPWIQTLFNQILHPERTLPPPHTGSNLFNFSLGIPLSDYPLIHDALLILELLKPEFSLDTVSKILNALYLFGNPTQNADNHYAGNHCIQKTAVDLLLKKHGRLSWTLNDLVGFCKHHQLKATSPKFTGWEFTGWEFADWIERLENLQALFDSIKKPLSPENISNLFLNAWQAMGWPGNRTLNSHEYQQSEKLLQLLKQFRQLNRVNEALSISVAIRLFKQLTNETIFQEQSEVAPLLISGLLEAAPLFLQKQYNLPHCSAERELNYANDLLEGFIENSQDLVISYPARAQDKQLRASSLLNRFKHIDKTDFAVADTTRQPEINAEIDSETSLTELPEHYPAQGGSGILTSQALCPFKAAAQYRLNAAEPDIPGDGVSAMDRGIQIHKALELLWQQIKSLQQLSNLSAEALQTLINKTLDKVLFAYQSRRPDLYSAQFTKLEKQRLQILLLEWFELEKQRLHAFKVVGTEEKNTIEVGGLLLKTQADRIDQLENGKRIIIDYKTGSSASSRSWQEEAILEPQLPLYSLAEDDRLAALALAQVHEKACRFTGLADDNDLLPGVSPVGQIETQLETGTDTDTDTDTESGWQQIRKHWRIQLDSLAEEFRSGSVEINPHNCQFCNLQALCRKHEIPDESAVPNKTVSTESPA